MRYVYCHNCGHDCTWHGKLVSVAMEGSQFPVYRWSDTGCRFTYPAHGSAACVCNGFVAMSLRGVA